MEIKSYAFQQEGDTGMTVTKNHIIEGIQKESDQKKAEIQRTFESLVEIMKQTLVSGEDIMISGFGKFCVKEKKERNCRSTTAMVSHGP